jgi:hypothetical protein
MSMGSLWAALPASPRARGTYRCDVVIWAGPMPFWVLQTAAPPNAAGERKVQR